MQDDPKALFTRAALYLHQREAVHYAMQLFGLREGGDVPSSMMGVGCALLMEM